MWNAQIKVNQTQVYEQMRHPVNTLPEDASADCLAMTRTLEMSKFPKRIRRDGDGDRGGGGATVRLIFRRF